MIHAQIGFVSEPSARLPDDPTALKAMVAAREAEIDRLHQIIRELQRHRFGRRAESLPVDQLLLGLEEAEQIEAGGLAETDAADASARAARTRQRRANRGALPAHLPRIERMIDVDDRTSPCCRGDLHVIDEYQATSGTGFIRTLCGEFGSSCGQHTLAEKGEVGPSEHRALQHLQAADLPFDRAR